MCRSPSLQAHPYPRTLVGAGPLRPEIPGSWGWGLLLSSDRGFSAGSSSMSLPSNPPLSSPRSASNTPGSFLPQGLCPCCCLCLEPPSLTWFLPSSSWVLAHVRPYWLDSVPDRSSLLISPCQSPCWETPHCFNCFLPPPPQTVSPTGQVLLSWSLLCPQLLERDLAHSSTW